jgi:hypothetical protein
MSVRSYGWCFTLNNYSEEEYEELLAVDCQYLIIGKEVGECGTPHLQGFVQFHLKKTLLACKKINPRAHWEQTKGSIDQNVEYCSKDGTFEERGIRPLSKKRQGEKEKERWDLALQCAKKGRWDEVPESILVRYGKGLEWAVQKIEESTRDLSDTDEKMEWYYGASGTGKSRRAREENPGAYLKACNKWWDGYRSQEVVIIEDFDKDHRVLCHHLKIWADRYMFPAEIKGGKIDIRPKKIIVTSNYHPRDIWESESDYGPILRRFRVVRFDVVKSS